MGGKENLLMLLTLNKTKLLLDCIEPKIRIKRILEATEDRLVGAEKFPKLVNLRLFPRSLITGIAHVLNVVDYLPKELSFLGKHIHESGVDGRVGNVIVVVVIVVPTRAISTVRSGSRTQIHPSKN
jgi:hypothetical protein